jgi:phosphoribosylformylglycinamidine synthase subunit PurS
VRFHFDVVVRLKEGLLDPQGKAIEESLPHLGWTNVSNVRVGKHIELDIDAGTEDDAMADVDMIAAQLLANPVIEDVEVRPVSAKGWTKYQEAAP